MIVSLLQSVAHENEEMWTLKKCITNPKTFSPKFAVVADQSNHALYFSRAPSHLGMKAIQKSFQKSTSNKHVGCTLFQNTLLKKFHLWGQASLKMLKKLEQRLRNMVFALRLHETEHEVRGITPEDLAHAEEIVRKMTSQDVIPASEAGSQKNF